MTVQTQSELLRVTRDFRARLIGMNDQALADMARQWNRVLKGLTTELDKVTADIHRAIAAGKVPGVGPETSDTFSRAWIMQHDRLQAMVRKAQAQMIAIADAQAIARAKDVQAAARAGRDMAQAQFGEVGIGFDHVPVSALESFTGATRPGSPLHTLFKSLPADFGTTLQSTITAGIGLGLNPREMAKRVTDAVGGNFYRASVIARTETMRAFREAARETYRANADAGVKGYVWVCARDVTTCEACWSMDGTEFGLEESAGDADDHPNGRCTIVPIIEGYDLSIGTGEDAFNDLPDDEQEEILGPERLDMYRSGKVQFLDFRTMRHSPQWGSHPQVTPLRDLRRIAREPKVVPPVVIPEGPAWRFAEDQAGLTGVAQKEARAIHEALAEELPGLESSWNGTIHKGYESWNGLKDWSCWIGLKSDFINPVEEANAMYVTARTEKRLSVLIHESLHAYSPELTQVGFAGRRGWEEGIVEMLHRLLRPGMFRRFGYTETQISDLEYGALARWDFWNGYQRYIGVLERTRKKLKMKPEAFYRQIFAVPVERREDFVVGLVDNAYQDAKISATVDDDLRTGLAALRTDNPANIPDRYIQKDYRGL